MLKSIIFSVFCVLVIFADSQTFSYLQATAYEMKPEGVVVAISPEGQVFRGEIIDLLPQFGQDTFRINKLGNEGQLDSSTDVGGYIMRAAIEADNQQVYLNLELYAVNNYPVILPGVGLIETGEYTDGTLIVALDHSLQVLWYEFFGSNFLSGFWECDIHIASNGNILFNAAGNHPDYFLYLLLKEYTPDGEFVQELFQTELVYAIEDDSQGNIYLTGPCANLDANFNGVEVTFSNSYNFYVVKYNSNHDYQWSNFVEDLTCSHTDLVITPTDQLFLSVSLISGNYWFDDILAEVGNGLHFVIAKLNTTSGAFEWVQILTEPIDDNGICMNHNNAFLTCDSDGSLFLCGNAYGELLWNNGLVSSNMLFRPFVAKIANTGVVDWVALADEYTQFTNIQRIEFSETGALVFGGTGKGMLRFDTLQVDLEGYYSYVAEMQVENLAVSSFGSNNFSAKIYPNPTKDILSVELPVNPASPCTITIYRYDGREILTVADQFNKLLKLNLSALSPGIYTLKIQYESRVAINKFSKL